MFKKVEYKGEYEIICNEYDLKEFIEQKAGKDTANLIGEIIEDYKSTQSDFECYKEAINVDLRYIDDKINKLIECIKADKKPKKGKILKKLNDIKNITEYTQC